MEKYFLLVVVISSMLIALVITRKDKDGNGSLNKMGFIKIVTLFTCIFVFVVVYVLTVS
ncbi:hypothetical protein [Ferdinandcohnia sp. Marseille-Q9671]